MENKKNEWKINCYFILNLIYMGIGYIELDGLGLHI